MILLPGVQVQGGNAQVAGQPNTQVSHGFDGVENDRQGNQMNNVYFFEELTVGSVNAGADQSWIANYQLTSKRGTDHYHGSLLYRHFNSGLEARLFFDPKKTPFLRAGSRFRTNSRPGIDLWECEAAGVRRACVAAISLFVLVYEEPTLKASFGPEYEVFCAEDGVPAKG